MDMSDDAREYIADEIGIAVDMMRDAKGGQEKLYFFSAIFGALQRIYNIEYDDDLVFAFFVVNAVHQGFMQRITAFTQGGDSTVMISGAQFDRLTDLAEELGEMIQKKEDPTSTLKKMVIVMHSTTGNGYYLMKKGLLKI